LHYTGNDEADRLIADEPFALLMGFALDQQVPVPTAFSGPLKLKQRLGTLDPGKIAATDPAKVEAAFREKPAIHRFPGNMARRVQELAAIVTGEYGGDAGRLWTEASDGADLRRRLSELPGFGEMTIKSLSAVLAKRFGVEAARELARGQAAGRGDVRDADPLDRARHGAARRFWLRHLGRRPDRDRVRSRHPQDAAGDGVIRVRGRERSRRLSDPEAGSHRVRKRP